MEGRTIFRETLQNRTATKVAALKVISGADEVEISVGKVSMKNMTMVLAETEMGGGLGTISPRVACPPQAAWKVGLETLVTVLMVMIVCVVLPLKVKGMIKVKGQGTPTFGTPRVAWSEGPPTRVRVSMVESTEGDHLGRGKTWVVVDGKCKVS